MMDVLLDPRPTTTSVDIFPARVVVCALAERAQSTHTFRAARSVHEPISPK